MKVAFTHNLRLTDIRETEKEAEYDSAETVGAIAQLAARGAPSGIAGNEIGDDHRGVEGDGVAPVGRSGEFHAVTLLRGDGSLKSLTPRARASFLRS